MKRTKDKIEDFEEYIFDVIEPPPQPQNPLKANPDILENINQIRRNPQLRANEKHKAVSEIIINDLMMKGQFYRTKENRLFWMDMIKYVLFDIEKEEFNYIFFYKYDLNVTTQEGKFVYQEIKNYCFNEGLKTNVYKFVHYNREKNILYKFDNKDKIFKISGDKIEVTPNGTDRILFEREYEAEPIVPTYTNNKPLFHYLFENMNFEGEYVEQLFLFKHWFFSLFFPELFDTKPICLLYGVKGSGKSLALRYILKIFYGLKANVFILTDKEDDFISSLSNNYFLAIDNADEYIRYLNNYLASISTGTAIKKRKFYTTNEELTIYPRVFVAVTARTPHFRRDDVADRLLIFKVRRYDEFESENELLNNIYKHRSEIWGDILTELNIIVKKLGQNTGEGIKTVFRLADFYVFVRRQLNETEIKNFDEIINKVIRSQTDYVSEDEPLFEALNIYMKDKFEESLTTGEWFHILKEISDQNKIAWYKSSRSFGMKVRNLIAELNSYYDVQEIPIRSNKKILEIKQKVVKD